MLKTRIELHREDSTGWETVTVSTAPEVFHEKDHFWPRSRLIGCIVSHTHCGNGRGCFPECSCASYREGAVEFAQMLIRAGFSLVKYPRNPH